MVKKAFLLFALLTYLTVSAQQITYQGRVTDTTKAPLTGANIIAIPNSDALSMEFSITDEQGRYRLSLEKDSLYVLEVSYLGFRKISDTINAKQNRTRNFSMQASKEGLDEILIKQKMAVLVKKDTITYRTKVFKTGEERKLKEVLEKLPGVEVSRNGEVTVNGKKVDKLMVDGKTFFTGDTKLAVENIPADAVDEVEVLDNYSEVPFLKGLEDSDKMAMNIKLSKGKKKFVFGDIEAGGGIKERYILHPTLFYYSPKTSVNLIGDFNNIGKKSFSMTDYINFEGGILSLMDNPGGFGIYNDDFARFLRNEDFTYSKNDFGAFNIFQQINSNLHMNAYSIAAKNKMRMREEKNLSYLNDNADLDEFRETTTRNKLFFSLNKLQLRYTPNADEDFTYDAFVKTSTATSNEFLRSLTQQDSSFISTKASPQLTDFTQHLKYSKQFSYEHTSTLTFNYTYSNDEDSKDWLFNRPLFSGIIPFVEEETLNLLQNIAYKKNQASLQIKHYWVLNNTNHVYPSVGAHFSQQQYLSLDRQLLSNGEINQFQQAGFNNNLNFKVIDPYFGFQYKMKLGDLILKPGLFYHYYLWNVNQLNEQAAHQSKAVILPEFEGDYEISSSEKLKLKYSLKSSFSSASRFANRLRLANFNQLYQGNENLKNQMYHFASLNYYKFSLYKGIFVNANVSYSKREQSVRSSTQIQGIDQVARAIYTRLPEETYSFTGSFSKKISNYKFTLHGDASLSNYKRQINNDTLAYDSHKYSYTFKTETSFENFPNVEIGLQEEFSNFKSDAFSNSFMKLNPYANFEYDFLDAFILKANYSYTYYENKNINQINRFQIGNASLYYNKENSPWGFEIEVNNFLDARYRRQNYFNEFIVTDQRIFIQPRTILFKISYKL